MSHSKKMLVGVFVGVVLLAGSRVDAQESEDAISAVAWNSDSTSLAVGHLNGQIEVTSADGQVQHSLVAHTGRVTELAWHPDGNLLASGSADGSVRIWDTSTSTLIRSYTALTLITGLLWSRDGSQLWAISIGDQPNLLVWNTETGDLISSADVGGLYDPQWNEDGTLLIAGSGGTVPVLVTTRKKIRSKYIRKSEFPIETGEQMFTAAWSPDDVYVAGGTPNGHVRVWNVDTAQLVLDVGGGENYDVSTWQMSLIVELAFTPDGQQIQALDGSGMFRVWDVASSELLKEEQLPVTGTPIYAATFSPDGTYIAYGGEDGELNVASAPSVDVSLAPTFSGNPSKFYIVTREPRTEQNIRIGQTVTIWEVDAVTETSRRLLALAPVLEGETPESLFSERELGLLEKSGDFPPERLDAAWIFSGLEAIAVLDKEHLLIVMSYYVYTVLYRAPYGQYDLQILDLHDGSLTSSLIVDYHASFVEEIWRCVSYVRMASGRFVPNPVTNQFAFTVTPDYGWCGNGLVEQSYLVDYSTSPAQVEVLPFTRELAWSPDGSMLAYAGMTQTEENRWLATYSVRSAALGAEPRVVAQYPADPNYPDPLITWLDPHTIAYQYTDYRTLSDQPVWSAYDLDADQVVFSEGLLKGELYDLDYLYEGKSHLVYRWYGKELDLMLYLAETGIIEVQTLSSYPAPSNSKFRQYVVLGAMDNPALQILRADAGITEFDLSPFVPPGHSLAWVVLGPPHFE